ncbi:putative adenylyltransferase/sulfurtransferase MoeZ [Pseudodesulfovibrio hydrargyri]|uniref:Putative adenylyltransferase/sulfurtransferase MoeZ n=1 Tax=Pseudodesulfovibrio hydrargyri TaxID=2125990 RepID=A0A1J5NA72_9BACT|nr:rhodanese-like domain-containing protein [Pseudodesulfovibrio hydrargyri]OIQ50119.1 putative adenylyltransferase/sulfurtransferase MoeZ [Pseudodesulfovibrio hydrargyri]
MRVFTAALIVLALLVLWDVGWWLAGVRPLSPWALKAELKRADTPPPTLIDVRTRAEYAFFHIPGAVNVPYPATLNELALAALDPTKPVVVICMTGHRSPPTVRQMQRGGYTDVRNLTGGMAVWKLFGGDTVSP